MPARVAAAYRAERHAATAAMAAGDIATAWRHLERAHIIAQPYPVAHVGSHGSMLRLAFKTRDRHEFAGQLVRVLVAGPASATGRVPTGNTGRAAVALRAEMPLPADLEVGLLHYLGRERPAHTSAAGGER